MVKKRTSKRKSPSKKTAKPSYEPHIQNAVMDNFVALQKVMTNLSIKIDDLTTQLSKLLQLFEISAKALAEKEVKISEGGKDSKEIIDKLENLFEQNKILARGLTLLHENKMPSSNPNPQQPGIPRPSENSVDMNQYQKSISSPPPGFNRLPRR